MPTAIEHGATDDESDIGLAVGAQDVRGAIEALHGDAVLEGADDQDDAGNDEHEAQQPVQQPVEQVGAEPESEIGALATGGIGAPYGW